jgi:hypothetical protein
MKTFVWLVFGTAASTTTQGVGHNAAMRRPMH